MINTKTIQYPFGKNDLKMRISYNGSGDMEYIGYAAPGTLTSAAAWQICKLTYSGSDITQINFASGVNDYTKVWDNYLGYSYS